MPTRKEIIAANLAENRAKHGKTVPTLKAWYLSLALNQKILAVFAASSVGGATLASLLFLFTAQNPANQPPPLNEKGAIIQQPRESVAAQKARFVEAVRGLGGVGGIDDDLMLQVGARYCEMKRRGEVKTPQDFSRFAAEFFYRETTGADVLPLEERRNFEIIATVANQQFCP